MFIDDEKHFGDLMYDIFANEPYNITCENNGTDALNHDMHNLYIVDLGLPGMDGIQTLEALARKFNQKVDAFIITGYEPDFDKAFRKERGIRHVLHKPFDMAILKKLIKNHFAEKESVLNT